MDGIDVSWGSHIPQRCASLPPYWRWLLPHFYVQASILHRADVQTGNEIIIDGAKFRGYVGRWHRGQTGNEILIDGAKFRGYVGRWHRVQTGNEILIDGAGHLPPFPTRDSQIRAMTAWWVRRSRTYSIERPRSVIGMNGIPQSTSHRTR